MQVNPCWRSQRFSDYCVQSRALERFNVSRSWRHKMASCYLATHWWNPHQWYSRENMHGRIVRMSVLGQTAKRFNSLSSLMRCHLAKELRGYFVSCSALLFCFTFMFVDRIAFNWVFTQSDVSLCFLIFFAVFLFLFNTAEDVFQSRKAKSILFALIPLSWLG